MRIALGVAMGGLAGTLLRFLVSSSVVHDFSRLPRATLLVNVLGSLALGFVLRWSGLAEDVAPTMRAALAVGFCGAFTTMSTFSYELFRFGQARQWTLASVYFTATIIGTLVAVWAGYRLGALTPS